MQAGGERTHEDPADVHPPCPPPLPPPQPASHPLYDASRQGGSSHFQSFGGRSLKTLIHTLLVLVPSHLRCALTVFICVANSLLSAREFTKGGICLCPSVGVHFENCAMCCTELYSYWFRRSTKRGCTA
jgi:hypothetical protein